MKNNQLRCTRPGHSEEMSDAHGPTDRHRPQTRAPPSLVTARGEDTQGPTTRTPPRVLRLGTVCSRLGTTCHTCARPVLAYRLLESSPRRAHICRQHTIAQTLRSSGEVAPPQGSALDIDTRTLRPHRRITLPRGSAQSRHHATIHTHPHRHQRDG